jgi:hypothetical protein
MWLFHQDVLIGWYDSVSAEKIVLIVASLLPKAWELNGRRQFTAAEDF